MGMDREISRGQMRLQCRGRLAPGASDLARDHRGARTDILAGTEEGYWRPTGFNRADATISVRVPIVRRGW